MPFEPLPPVEPTTHMLLEVNEVFSVPDIEKLMQTYDTLHDLLTGQTNDDVKLSLEKCVVHRHSTMRAKTYCPCWNYHQKNNKTTTE